MSRSPSVVSRSNARDEPTVEPVGGGDEPIDVRRVPWWTLPIQRRAFWAVQGLVVAIALGHTLVETIGRTTLPAALYLVPSSLFFVPVVYAALKFGVRGAIPTALWSSFLTLPNLVFLHAGLERLGVVWQSVILFTVAAFVGIRVDHERAARGEAEDRELARRTSDERYRGLFDNAAEAVLVVGPDGAIEEANEAATRLLDRPLPALRGSRLADAVGDDVARGLLAVPPATTPLALRIGDGRPPIWVEPVVCSPIVDPEGRVHVQAMLHDVTSRYERQRGLEGYARRTVVAREEERRRIARELHDGPLQSLVLLSRKLDALDESGGSDGFGGAGGSPVVGEARDIVERTAAEVRGISRALRPPILDDLGLVPALRSEAGEFARRSGIPARFGSVGPTRALAPDVELMLLRVTQEALHNVERHARASRVEVGLAFESGQVVLHVRDDGIGAGSPPTPSELLAAGKLGLVGMQERARLVNGEFSIRGEHGEGTTVEVAVPA